VATKIKNTRPLKTIPVVLAMILFVLSGLSFAASSAPPPPWAFKGAYANYALSETTNAAPANLSSATPDWAFAGSYANYTITMSMGSSTGEFTENYTVLHVYPSNGTFSFMYKMNTSSSVSYVYYAPFSESSIYQITSSSSNGYPAVDAEYLYYYDEGMPGIGNVYNTTVTSGVSFAAMGHIFKSDLVKYHFNSSSRNASDSVYVSYDTGLELGISLNETSGGGNVTVEGHIAHTNVPDSGHPQFTVGISAASGESYYSVLAVNNTSGMFSGKVSSNASLPLYGSPNASGTYFNGTFQQPSIFPVINESTLAAMNAGKAPSSFFVPNATVGTNITITVPAGTFLSDRANSSHNGTIFTDYVNTKSGLQILMTVNFTIEISPGNSIYYYLSERLNGTNIPMSSPLGIPSTYIDLGVIAVLAVVVIAAATALGRSRHRR
jgi:hypothetical protein